MTAVLSLLVVLSVSVIVMRIATVALLHTGLSREAAQFQVRSAFTGVGFTTGEAETVVNHPVRRRIIMFLMLVGNVGIVSAMASLLLTFIKTDAAAMPISTRIIILCTGLALPLFSLPAVQDRLDVAVRPVVDSALALYVANQLLGEATFVL